MLKNQLDYSAVYAKVMALYGRRLKRENYDALTRCNTVIEIATYLKEHTQYCEIFNQIDILSLHRGDLENVLRNEFDSEYTKFFKFLGKRDIAFVKRYESRMLIGEMLRFLVMLNNGNQAAYQCRLPARLLENGEFRFDRLQGVKSYEEFLQVIKPSFYYELFAQSAPRNEAGVDIPLLDSALNTAYFSSLLDSVKKERQKSVRENMYILLKTEADLLNIIRILRLKKYYRLSTDEGLVYMISVYYRFTKELAQEILEAPDFDSALAVLDKTPYGDLFRTYGHVPWTQKAESYRQRINKRLIRVSPPSICSVITYLNLRQIEMHNLVNIIEGVRYRLPRDQIENYLVGNQG